MRHGLVLTGGGARGAYQAGVLRGIAEITGARETPFPVVAGVSAGAINGAVVATESDDFDGCTERLWNTWTSLKTEDVFRTDAISLASISTRWIRDLSFGGLIGRSSVTNLLDTAPLRALLATKLDFGRLKRNFEAKKLHGVAVSATNYISGTAVTFFEGAPEIEPWYRSTRIAIRAQLDIDSVLASAAIPIFFPPVRLRGSYYGDGCIRLGAPLSPAVHMGAERVIAIGIRHARPQEVTIRLNQTVFPERISLVHVAGILLNAVFLDSLETDLERMERINRTLALLSAGQRQAQPDQLRRIPILAIKPSRDLGTLALEHFNRLPHALRYMLRGLGASDERGWDLLSYLTFDRAYTGQLLELGRQDALARKEEILRFMDPATPL